jgi:hypothetical protein
MIPFLSAGIATKSPKGGAEKKKTQNSDGSSFWVYVYSGSRGLVANSLKWQSSDCYYAVTLAVNSTWILLIELKKSPHLS